MLDMESMPRVLDWCPKDHLRDLQQQIDQMHFSYLETDDSPQKIEQRHKLEGFIREYLCLVPHSRKFVLRETLQVLHKSAASQSFSGYRAALAWNAIARYAANLLTQPWRKEYKEIKLYCGFYKHEIDENLVGAEIMFEAMGYKRIDGSTLLLEGPICPDQVAHVSRDSLVAVVECQLLKSVWESVSAICNVKWLEALQFRELHIGGPEQACKALLYKHNENNYQQCKHENNYNSYGNLSDLAYQQYPPIITPEIAPQCLYGQFFPPNPYTMNCFGHMPSYSVNIPVNMTNSMGIPFQQAMQNYVLPNYMNPIPKHYARYGYNNQNAVLENANDCAGQAHVATGQLIEVDSGQNITPQLSKPSYTKYEDVVDSKANIEHFANYVRTEKFNNNKEHNSKEGVKSDESFETWDYVYRDLEKQGYSKDLGERENVLEKTLESSFLGLNLHKSSKSNEIVSGNDTKKLMNNNKQSSNRTNNNKYKSEGSIKYVTKKSNQYSESTEQIKPQLKKTDNWQCITCTFNNSNKKVICEMCGKSKNAGSEIQPLTSGGKECSKCTLVNERDTKICIACGASLLDSPTYI